nr:immunoglobulin light chain junction region [Macaca mulatta]MOV82724.1 immunoglobulin light chain junction region [Macaca mulatta]MOV83665.1 immunoglobulin light chain junction region [Macaca mulatta]MOV83971.1 immunoglobulin light chain junction region [Macaca mulatta]MOV84021.1 immunoglobulin light chain junction region [Macaca mulatta]
CQQHDNFPYIF